MTGSLTEARLASTLRRTARESLPPAAPAPGRQLCRLGGDAGFPRTAGVLRPDAGGRARLVSGVADGTRTGYWSVQGVTGIVTGLLRGQPPLSPERYNARTRIAGGP